MGTGLTREIIIIGKLSQNSPMLVLYCYVGVYDVPVVCVYIVKSS